jgi:hypothetical protein
LWGPPEAIFSLESGEVICPGWAVSKAESAYKHLRRESIADSLKKAGGGSVSAVDCDGRTIFIADVHRDGGKCFVLGRMKKLGLFWNLNL